MNSECIEHKQKGTAFGYGSVYWEGKTGRLHRKVYADTHGLSRADVADVVIRHTCDNARCINPLHLIPGTQTDNLNDRKERHRYRKLTAPEALTIKLRTLIGESARSLGREYGVSHTMVLNIKQGRQWA